MRFQKYFLQSKARKLTRCQKKDQKIESLNLLIDSLGKRVEEFEKSSKELAEERVALSQLKEQHSNELVKQKTKLDDACKHYQNTLKEEQGKLQLKEEELGAANSEISRIKSETAKQTEVQKALVVDLQGRICGLEEDLETAKSDKQNLTNALAEKSQAHSLLAQTILLISPKPKPDGSDMQARLAAVQQRLNTVNAFVRQNPL